MLIGFLVLGTGYVSSAALNSNSVYWSHLLDWLCFIQITRISYYLFFENSQKSIKIFSYVCIFSTIAIAVNVLINIDFSSFFYQNSLLEMFFGNRNFLAEFLGTSYVVQFFNFQKNDTRKLDLLFFTSLLLTSILIGMTLCRTAWLGCLLASVYFLLSNWKLKNTKRYLALISIFIFSICSYPAFKIIYEVSGKNIHNIRDGKNTSANFRKARLENTLFMIDEKNTSANVRKARLGNTFFMIKDNPFGIGPGNFEFNYSKYHSRWKEDTESVSETIIKSPHNGYFELFVEGGVISFVGLLIVLYSIIKNISSSQFVLPMGFFIYWLIDVLFDFPLETGVMFFVTAIFFGIYLSSQSLGNVQITIKSFYIITLKSIFLLSISTLCLFSFLSYYFEYNYYNDLSKIKIACSIFPENWRACIRKAELEASTEHFDDSINTLQKILHQTPSNFVALDLLGETYWKKGDITKACSTIYIFDKIFLNKSHLHTFYESNCL